jgi:hypothetical protein
MGGSISRTLFMQMRSTPLAGSSESRTVAGSAECRRARVRARLIARPH